MKWWFYIDDDFFSYTFGYCFPIFTEKLSHALLPFPIIRTQTLASLFHKRRNEWFMCPSSLSANTHNTKKKCTEDGNRKQEKFTVQEGSREGRKRQQSIRGDRKYIFGRKVFTTKLLTDCIDKVRCRMSREWKCVMSFVVKWQKLVFSTN